MPLRNWYNCGTKHFHKKSVPHDLVFCENFSVVWWNLKRNWYNCGTKHFHQTSVVWWNLKRNTQLD